MILICTGCWFQGAALSLAFVTSTTAPLGVASTCIQSPEAMALSVRDALCAGDGATLSVLVHDGGPVRGPLLPSSIRRQTTACMLEDFAPKHLIDDTGLPRLAQHRQRSI